MLANPAGSDKKARENWNRYEYARLRGHTTYTRTARRNEEMYLGGGLQWRQEDLAALSEENRPAYEVNETKIAVDSAIGYQINNRLDISFSPRGGTADDKSAEILNRVVMQVADNIKLQWKETEVFGDGLIQQRGYYDIRLAFDDAMTGEVGLEVLDPMDVLPDPDAKSYDPDKWNDVLVTRWLTYDDIEQAYGKKARKAVERREVSEDDWGEHEDDSEDRAKFGREAITGGYADHVLDRPNEKISRVRVIDRQRWVYAMTRVAVTQEGDVRDIEALQPDAVMRLEADGAIITKRMQRRVRWTVSTYDQLLHDDWSPYPWFTVVPYFPYFRRGQTRGMVDNAIGPQEIVNKAISQYIHALNSTANSGWLIEENSLSQMDREDLEHHGAETGLILEYKKGSTKPEKIQPNQVPTGIDRIIDRAFQALKDVTVPDAMRGLDGGEKSGVAIQSRQFAAQQSLAVALDNLARTRNMIARRILWLVQHFYDEQRVFRITETRPDTGKQESFDLPVNVPDPITGDVVNDLTVGEYDVVISEQPLHVTFENSQYEQAIEMRREGVALPDSAIINASMLTNKEEILQQMQGDQKPDPMSEAEVKLKMAQAAKADADAARAKADTRRLGQESVNKGVEAQYSAIQTAQTIAMLPETAPLADSLLKSAGFVDADAAPIVPNAPPGIAQQETPQQDDVIPESTNPLTPANPGVGRLDGYEGGEQDPPI